MSLPARYRSPALSADGEVRDLSCEGMFLCAEVLDRKGAIVAVELALPGAETHLRLQGEVVRTREVDSGMGIRFHGVGLATRLQLANYMLLQSSRAAH